MDNLRLILHTGRMAQNESRLDSMIADLREYADWLATESERVRRALAALDPEHEEAASTIDQVYEVFQGNPDEVMTAAEVYDAMRETGWKSLAKDPVNVVRTALARLAQDGKLERLEQGRGRYRLPPAKTPVMAPPTPVKVRTDSSNSSDPFSDDDPWGSPPKPSDKNPFADEPPF